MSQPTSVLSNRQATDTIVDTVTTIVRNFFSSEVHPQAPLNHIHHSAAQPTRSQAELAKHSHERAQSSAHNRGPRNGSAIGGGKLNRAQSWPLKLDCKLMPFFPHEDGLDKVSSDAKVMVAAINKCLKSSLPATTKFEDIQGHINAHLQLIMTPKPDGMKQNHKIFSTQDRNFFNFAPLEVPTEENVDSVRNWISNELITDTNVLATSGFENRETIHGLISISKSNFELLLHKTQDESLVADVGILTYPSPADETICLTNIKIYVWIKIVSIAGGFMSKYEVGLRGSVFSQTYEPSAEGIKKLEPQTIENAVKAYNAFVCEVNESFKDRSVKL